MRTSLRGHWNIAPRPALILFFTILVGVLTASHVPDELLLLHSAKGCRNIRPGEIRFEVVHTGDRHGHTKRYDDDR